ncbi:MAG: phosphotransferase, partial [Myxococcota bacterium]
TFLMRDPAGLWPRGTYWHLHTRPDELQQMADGPLKRAAGRLDEALSQSAWKTVVHGDAKLANFCFAVDGGSVAAVDFQYAGGGVGVQDVAYFLGSCLGEAGLRASASGLLEAYFLSFRDALAARDPGGAGVLAHQVEREWRALWPVAWADFERFLAGWAPSHVKRTGFAAELSSRALAAVESGCINP